MRPVITLTTDFGWQDSFVGTMKGVILGIAPAVRLVDLTHGIPPQDVRAGAYALYAAYRYFPAPAIHLAVVDPGVGSARRLVAVRTSWGTFVAPDNGLLSLVLSQETVQQAVALENPAYRLPHVSRTFHGRDILAPAAAHIARGVPLAELGPAVATLTTFPVSRPTRHGQTLTGHVIYIDHFGNLVTDVTEADCAGPVATITAGLARIAGLSDTYAAVAPGQPLALIGSAGHLEIAVREGDAARALGLGVGDPVAITFDV